MVQLKFSLSLIKITWNIFPVVFKYYVVYCLKFYEHKILSKDESDRFLKIVQNLKNLKSGELHKLNLEVKKSKLKRNLKKGIF